MSNEIITSRSTSVTERMAEKYGTDKGRFYNIVKATCRMDKSTNEQFEAFLMTAEKYDLNPIMKQMWAYPDRNGGIMTMVAADGWINIVNNRPEFDGYETSVVLDEKGYPVSATCTMWRKDRTRPTTKTVYLKEWIKESSPVWKQMPIHFIEMRAYIQCARMCFNISGIYDGDVTPAIEGVKFADVIDVSPQSETPNFAAALEDTPSDTVQTTIADDAEFEINPDAAAQADLLK